MKEYKIIVDIDSQGGISAEADGFKGEACIRDLERLLEDLAASQAELRHKPEAKKVGRIKVQRQRVEKKQ